MATSNSAPWTIMFSSAIVKAQEKAQPKTATRPTATATTQARVGGATERFVPPAVDARVLRQLRDQLTLERLLKATPLNKDRAEVPLDLLYVDAARWDRLEARLEPASDDNER